MEVEVRYDDRGNVDGVATEMAWWPRHVYEVPDELAKRWIEAQAAWEAVRDEIEQFTSVNKSKGQLENEARDEELIRRYYL